MSIKYTNLTYKELIKLAPRDKPFQVVVQSNYQNKGGKQTLWATIQDSGKNLDTCLFKQNNINPDWRKYYTATFDLIIHHLDDTTLERYNLLDHVEFSDSLIVKHPNLIGKIFKITDVIFNDNSGFSYKIDNDLVFPHFSLRKVISKEPQTIQIGNETYYVTEELTKTLKNLKKV